MIHAVLIAFAAIKAAFGSMERRGSICRERQMVSQPENGARLSTTTTGSGLGEIRHSEKNITVAHAAQMRGTESQISHLRRVS
jgi:hypothetical protein